MNSELCCFCGEREPALWLCDEGAWCEPCMIRVSGYPALLPVAWWSRAINRQRRWAEVFLDRLRTAYYGNGLDGADRDDS